VAENVPQMTFGVNPTLMLNYRQHYLQ